MSSAHAKLDAGEGQPVARKARAKTDAPPRGIVHATALAEARSAGLLDGDKSEHVSFRAPPALVAAAKRETGVESTSELGMLALALLAQTDPTVAFMKRTRGRLGKDHTLDY